MRQLVLLLAILLLAGCATQRNLGGAKQEIEVSFASPNVQPNLDEVGVFVISEPQGVRVKVRNRPLLALIDEVAYQKGFNYRVLSDLTGYQVSLHEPPPTEILPGDEGRSEWERSLQKSFVSERALFDEVTRLITQNYLAAKNLTLRYRWVSDGPEFFLARAGLGEQVICSDAAEASPRCDSTQIAFKKFFVRNVMVEEAQRSIKTLFFKEDTEPNKPEIPVALINKDNPQNATMVAYKPQNAIVLRSTDPSLVDKVSQALFALDASYQQVLVETLIFQYDDSIAKRIGTALNYKKERTNADGTKTVIQQLTTQFGEGITSALPQFFFMLPQTEQKAALLTNLSLYDRDGLVRILAEPRLALQSGETASVSLKTNKYVLTQGVNVAGEVKLVESGISLKITPTVLGNGKVRLAVDVVESEFLPNNEETVVLVTNENKVSTSIIAIDGEMVSIGGIHSRRDSKFASGIPLLRQIPGVGYLFGSRASDGSTSRIEFMIRPTVERATQRLRGIQNNIEKTNLMIHREIIGSE